MQEKYGSPAGRPQPPAGMFFRLRKKRTPSGGNMLCCCPDRADTYGWRLPPVCVFFGKKNQPRRRA